MVPAGELKTGLTFVLAILRAEIFRLKVTTMTVRKIACLSPAFGRELDSSLAFATTSALYSDSRKTHHEMSICDDLR